MEILKIRNTIKTLAQNLLLFLCFLTAFSVRAQLGFCTGNSGDPIFIEDFGVGTSPNALPAGTTSYIYTTGEPNDGYYTVSSRTNYFDWFNIQDHTPGDTNGKCLIINADFTAGEFYRTTISGLCENTSYEFSSWMINLLPASGCGGQGIPINVQFEIWDKTDATLLASGNTGNIQGTNSPNWQQYALVFQTLPGQSEVILKMRNNGPGGCGNDLALDDIVFKSCGDRTVVEDEQTATEISICEDEVPYSKQLTAIPDNSVFSTHYYQWQQSNDGSNWTDIPGETSDTYDASLINTTTYFRVKVAEDAVNLNNGLCNSFSDVYEFRVVNFPSPPASNGDLNICENDPTPLSVTVPNGVLVNWYDQASGGNLLQADSNTYKPSQSGTYYAEAQTINAGCLSQSRTAVKMTYDPIPMMTDEQLTFCENTSVMLEANVQNASIVDSYLWSTGENTKQIQVFTPGVYTVEAFSANCSSVKTITVEQIDNPIIDSIYSDGNDIVVETANSGPFLYSLDGHIFQQDNVFKNIDGGMYTIYVKHRDCQQLIAKNYLHFYIPKYFTPNGDGIHDTFDLSGIEFYSSSQVAIYDRYGKLLKFSSNQPFQWNGLYKGKRLPANDYWYVITIEGQTFKGNFSLKY
ncbi:T9SS type B sorting domain-containing protein [Gaetbulibacter aestuarii]|uniref:T9SS type B sorting domain-containing protein n=1 Tax=Gaetbulibacter aestuarii TaxID=1502358 RepID=A0ABW7MWP2_9FLAO